MNLHLGSGISGTAAMTYANASNSITGTPCLKGCCVTYV